MHDPSRIAREVVTHSCHSLYLCNFGCEYVWNCDDIELNQELLGYWQHIVAILFIYAITLFLDVSMFVTVMI